MARTQYFAFASILAMVLGGCDLLGVRRTCADPIFMIVRPSFPANASDIEEACNVGLNPTDLASFRSDATGIDQFKTWTEITSWNDQPIGPIDRWIFGRVSATVGTFGNGAVLRDVTIYTLRGGLFEVSYRGTDVD